MCFPMYSPTEAHLGFAHAAGGQEGLEKRMMEDTEKGRHAGERMKERDLNE